MKFRHILLALAASAPVFMHAVPADPHPMELQNPDGSTVTVILRGDEHFNFMTDLSGSRILERDSRGFIVDAVRDGKQLTLCKADLNILREENPSNLIVPEVAAPASPMFKMGALNSIGRSSYPTVGKGNRSLVVLVEFDDQKFFVDNPKDYFTRQLNQPGFSDYGGSGSAIDYYLASSNGLYSPQFDVYGPVTVSGTAAYYQGSGTKPLEGLIRESLTALHDAGEIDFSNYDLDNDGFVDTVFFYYAGYGQADSDTETIWPHQYDYRYLGVSQFNPKLNSLVLDGKKIGPYACANELKGWNPQTRKYPWRDGSAPWVDGIGTFCHEYGHVLGLPDLYDVEYTEGIVVDTPGDWDVMDSGCYNFEGCVPPLMSAYEQWVCHWLEFTEAVDKTHYDIKALGSTQSPTAVRIGIPVSSNSDAIQPEYFIIEARDKSKWDACFPESGLLIWRINYSKDNWTGNRVNSIYGSNVVIHYANGDKHPAFFKGSIYPGSDNELIPSKSYPIWKSPVISSIGYDAESATGSFDYNMLDDVPTGAPLLHDNPFADENGNKNFYLKWDPVDGAESYQLTIKRSNTGAVYGVFDELNVGNVTSYKVVSVPISYWINELEVYVRAVKNGIPCSDKSNVIKFIPNSLPKGENNAVDGIEQDNVVISGGMGCIHAPEGAAVYDMTGKRLGSDGLAPGAYIVLYGSKCVKVLVR